MVITPSSIQEDDALVQYINLQELNNFDEQPAAAAVKVEELVYQQPSEDLVQPNELQHVAELCPTQPGPPPAAAADVHHEINLPSMICNIDFEGDYEFKVFINQHHGRKSPWIFSSALNKIFIGMNILFPIEFKFKPPPDDKQLYVRATPIYSETQHSMEMVMRCISHAQATEPTNSKYARYIWDHILRCHSRVAQYGGSKEDGRHFFVRIPLGQPPEGTDAYQFQYQFMCKNSCGTSGMNRRPLEVVFTLEDETGDVLGRRVLSVRICSCPKRDKLKEEQEHYKKTDAAPSKSTKKRKVEKKSDSSQEISFDRKEYKLEIPVVGSANARAVLKFTYDMMAGEMMRHNVEQPFKKCLKDIEQKLHAPLE